MENLRNEVKCSTLLCSRTFGRNDARWFAIFHSVCKCRREQSSPREFSTKVTIDEREKRDREEKKLRRMILFCAIDNDFPSRASKGEKVKWSRQMRSVLILRLLIDFNETRKKKRYIRTYVSAARGTWNVSFFSCFRRSCIVQWDNRESKLTHRERFTSQVSQIRVRIERLLSSKMIRIKGWRM